ncbi:MAG: hypothetical protein ACE5GW_09880 [Planctomycetota bacterium]
MSGSLTRSDRLFLAYARTHDLAQARALVEEDADLAAGLEVEPLFETLRGLSALAAEAFLELYRATPEEERRLCLCHYLYQRREGLTHAELRQLRDGLAALHPGRSPEIGWLCAAEGSILERQGRLEEAVRTMTEAFPDLSRDSSPFARFVQCQLDRFLGSSYRRGGNYQLAYNHLKRGHETAERLRFRCGWSISQRFATLLWASGQYRDALEIHCDRKRRAAAREAGAVSILLDSHLSAAKCAIDLKATSTAEAELREARELLDAHPEARADLPGYYLLYKGETQVQRASFEEAMGLIKEAADHFESMTPPFHAGALDAKIALSHFALYEGDYRTAVLIMRKLLEEAEEKGCLEAQGRILALETYFYVSEEPPLRKAFENLTTRVHLINNPRLLFLALGNLYTYALEFLDEREQAFLLMRIKNLSTVLPKSCYEDLYRRYVTERYEHAIENRLARYVDEDWDGWKGWKDPDPEPRPTDGEDEPEEGERGGPPSGVSPE